MSDFVTIIKGEDKTVRVKLVKEDGSPFKLTGVTAASISFPKADGSAHTETATIDSVDAGELSCVLDNTDTAALKEGKRQAMYVTLDSGADKQIILKGFESACSVVAKPF